MNDEEVASFILDPNTGLSAPTIIYRKLQGKASLKQIQRVMTNLETYQRNKRQNKPQYNTITASYPGDMIQADLMDISNSTTANKGYKFILTFIDIFSRFVLATPIKGKSMPKVADAMESLIEAFELQPNVTKINKISTDDGPEFHNKIFSKMMRSHNIDHFITPAGTPNKMAIVERFHRTLRDKIELFTDHHDTAKFIDILPQLIDNYNNTTHSTLKATPTEILNGTKISKQKINRVTYPFKVGDKVRIQIKSEVFTKGSPKFSEDIYTITDVHDLSYSLQDDKGKSLARRYQGYELRKINPTSIIDLPKPKSRTTKATTKRVAKSTRNQKREPAFNDPKTHKVDDTGNVVIHRRHLQPKSSKRQLMEPIKKVIGGTIYRERNTIECQLCFESINDFRLMSKYFNLVFFIRVIHLPTDFADLDFISSIITSGGYMEETYSCRQKFSFNNSIDPEFEYTKTGEVAIVTIPLSIFMLGDDEFITTHKLDRITLELQKDENSSFILDNMIGQPIFEFEVKHPYPRKKSARSAMVYQDEST